MNIVIFGPPGAGKGTQSNYIVKKYNLFQLSTGELLRKEINNNSELGKKIESTIRLGNLVSDEIVGKIISKYILNIKYKNQIIFDGYPRNLTQAKNLDYILNKNGQKIDLVLKLTVSQETIKKRISERQSLENRSDDLEETAIKRIKTYEDNIKSVINFYDQSNLLKVIDGEGSIAKINAVISGLIDGIKG